MSALELYERLPVFDTFAELASDRHFTRLPADWSVVVADVEGSTAAIAEGRYRDVNTIGAACIAVVRNVLGPVEFPYVFGGDGAALVLPPDRFDEVLGALAALRGLAGEQFALGLRIGSMPVSEVEAAGAPIRVARYQITPGKSIAFFDGGGLTLAEERIKAEPERYAPRVAPARCSLAGLSCRWNAIPSRNGQVLALLVAALGGDADDTYTTLLRELDGIFGGGLDRANPVNVPQMTYKSFRQCLADERRYHAHRATWPYFARVLQIAASVVIFRLGVHPLVFSPGRYARAMGLHADYRKFDDMLRMVIDCTPAQAERIGGLLAEHHAAGRICYGLHGSDSALMTCLVEDLTDGHHIHFIDGGNGGYAMAAQQLKEQLRATREAAGRPG